MSDTKRVLVIGNGFDLAHGLKTKYMDFLDFTLTVSKTSDLSLYEKIKDNIWINYFNALKNGKLLFGGNWIDFETEISLVISSLDKHSQDLGNTLSGLIVSGQIGSGQIGKVEKNSFQGEKLITLTQLRLTPERMSKHTSLNRNDSLSKLPLYLLREFLDADLTQLIEILDSFFIEIEKEKLTKIAHLDELKPDKVVSFNYTHTFSNLYCNVTEVFYIHGEANRENTENNMVLGIDDYWTGAEKDTHTNFAIFKKYIQRMQRGTYRALQGSYNTIINILPSAERGFRNPQNKSELYFYGHSLAITDKDILLKLLQMNFGKTIVYYYSKPDEGQYMANMVVILGKEEFEKRMLDDKLEFRQIPKEEKIDTEHEMQLAGTV